MSDSGSVPSAAENDKRAVRAAIAAQACETCRTRKSKCDEVRPRCSLCERLDIECKYREPLPTKKDKSMQFMMEQLSRMEAKLDSLGHAVHSRDAPFDALSSPSFSPSGSALASPTAASSSKTMYSMSKFLQPVNDLRLPRESYLSPQHLTAPHKVLLWPAVTAFLQQSSLPLVDDLAAIAREGSVFLLRLELENQPNPLPYGLSAESLLVCHVVNEDAGQSRVTFPDFTSEVLSRYTDIFFNTYNVFYPLLDRHEFTSIVLPEVVARGFGYGDYNSVIALLVFALGRMAYDGVWAQPIQNVPGRAAGIRGGSVSRPPGLDFFNEARKRMGFLSTPVSLQNIQILQLSAIYYEACSRHVDFWRSTVSASMALQVLLKHEHIDWQSSRGHAIKKVYWTSNLMENWYHLDLDLPRTGISDYESTVPLPGETPVDEIQELVQLQFLALIMLRRLITRINVTLFEASGSSAPETDVNFEGPPQHVIHELSKQLDSWRTLLPESLQWRDDDRFGLPSKFSAQPGFSEPLFTVRPGNASNQFDFRNALVMVSAHLRSRYYYARFLTYRPFLFKALHSPHPLTEDEQRSAAECLKACLLWPISMDPPKSRKRLVPYLFAWTQNFLVTLLILRLIPTNARLRDITEKYIDPSEVEQTVYLLLDWLRDTRLVDAIANWGWGILEQIYSSVLNR